MHTPIHGLHTQMIRKGAFTLTAVIMSIGKNHWYKIFLSSLQT